MNDTLKGKINLLINLANADGQFDIKERAFIYNVCIRHGVALDTIGDLIENPEEIKLGQELPLDTRIDYLTDCLLLIVVNDEILPKEVEFFIAMGTQLGFNKLFLNKLIVMIREQPEITSPFLQSHIMSLLHLNDNLTSSNKKLL